MAENLDSPGGFGIEDTIEMGVGSQELLKDFFGAESSGGSPDDLEPIIKEVKDEEKPTPPVKSKVLPIDKEGGTPNPQQVISSFLQSGEEEEEGEEGEEGKEEQSGAQTATAENIDAEESPFVSLSKDLFKLGVFNLDEDEEEPQITTGEEFLERFNAEKKKGAIEIVNNFIGQFGEDYQNAFDAIFVKGVNPRDYFGTYNNIVNFAELDMTNEENQVTVMKRALSDQGFEPEDITTEIERLKNYADLESVATKYHKVLIKKEAAKLKEMEEASERELQVKTAIKNQYIQNVSTVLQEKVKAKEFDGIPINPKLAAELQDFLLVDKYKNKAGETLTDFDVAILELKRPENHAMKVKIALLLKVLEKDPTLSTIQKSGVTKKTDQLFGEVARQVSKGKAGGTTPPKRTSWFI